MSDDVHDDYDDDLDPTDAWLVEASHHLDDTDSDVSRLVARISSSLNRVRRPARALATDMPGVWISDRVVKQLLATQIRTGLGRLVVFASLDGAGDQIHAVRIGLIARYRDDLPVMSDHIRDAVEDVLVRTLGAKVTAQACRAIHVRWQDVYSREWLS
ncbi:hypothetical protein [Williamsia muralis]|jgi:hypothetical protein|uniref:hypothetical protein n=1 Tax=Williamsia marianensis TaxID=85044 RepID=UPI000DE5EF12|nr:hypothetical protein [Williamsia marianensis]PVY30096.1 hypothetical protein C7458_105343 [Williamsia marianensis]